MWTWMRKMDNDLKRARFIDRVPACYGCHVQNMCQRYYNDKCLFGMGRSSFDDQLREIQVMC